MSTWLSCVFFVQFRNKNIIESKLFHWNWRVCRNCLFVSDYLCARVGVSWWGRQNDKRCMARNTLLYGEYTTLHFNDMLQQNEQFQFLFGEYEPMGGLRWSISITKPSNQVAFYKLIAVKYWCQSLSSVDKILRFKTCLGLNCNRSRWSRNSKM